MDTIEFEPPSHSTCACCGGRSTNLTRFVTRDGALVAAYYASFTEGHDQPHAYGLAGLGDWGDDPLALSRRSAFAFLMTPGSDGVQVQIIDAKQSPWPAPTMLGRHLTRAEALAHPGIDAVYRLIDRIAIEDATVAAHLGSGDAA